LNFIGVHTIKLLDECVHQENTSDKWDIPWYITRDAKENTVDNTINAAYARRMMGRLDVIPSNTTAFLHSDWLYFLLYVIRQCSGREARANVCERVTIGFGFTSDWMTKRREFFRPIT